MVVLIVLKIIFEWMICFEIIGFSLWVRRLLEPASPITSACIVATDWGLCVMLLNIALALPIMTAMLHDYDGMPDGRHVRGRWVK
jgi:hypothetical protein